MLLFCQQCSFSIVLCSYHGSLSSSWSPKRAPCPLKSSRKPARGPLAPRGEEHKAGPAPHSQPFRLALPKRGRSRLQAGASSECAAAIAQAQAPSPRSAPPRPPKAPDPPRPAPPLVLAAPGAWRARVRRRCSRVLCSARCLSSTSIRTRTR